MTATNAPGCNVSSTIWRRSRFKRYRRLAVGSTITTSAFRAVPILQGSYGQGGQGRRYSPNAYFI